MKLGIAGHVRLDMALAGFDQHEIILAALHESEMVIDPRDAATNHVAIPFGGLHMVPHGN